MAPNNFRFHSSCTLSTSSKEVFVSRWLLYTEFIRGHHTWVFYQDMIVVVKTNIDITFANNRCFDLSLAEFMTFIILSYEMSVV